jgi:tetratricopeptide (TPR) repeat protein
VNLAQIDELNAIEMPDGFVWRPVRRHFGIKAFGVNAYTSRAGDMIVEEHTEAGGHEEIYLVLRGRVKFTIDGNEHELGQGQLVYVRDPSLKRVGVALTDDAAVLAVGGKPGEPHEISAWEYTFFASPAVRARRYEEARELLREGLEAKPGHPSILYDLACVEALDGETDRAFELLNEAIAKDERFRAYAQKDKDFASIKNDPRFPAAS